MGEKNGAKGLVNQLTHPFGFKFFGGSDYADNGMGDRAQEQQAKANNIGDFQFKAGQGLYNTYLNPTVTFVPERYTYDSNGVQHYTGGETTGPSQLQQSINGAPVRTGDMANYSRALENFATYNGLAQPGTTETNANGGIWGRHWVEQPKTTATNAGVLLPWQETQLAQEKGQISTARQNAISAQTSALGKQGIVSGPAYDNAMARINAQYDQMNQSHDSDFHSTAAQHQAQAQQVMAGLMQAGGQYDLANQQQKTGNIFSALNAGGNMMNSATGVYSQSAALDNHIGDQARQEHAATNSFWQGVAGAAAGGDFGTLRGAFKKNKETATKSSNYGVPYGPPKFNPNTGQSNAGGGTSNDVFNQNDMPVAPTYAPIKLGRFNTGYGAAPVTNGQNRNPFGTGFGQLGVWG